MKNSITTETLVFARMALRELMVSALSHARKMKLLVQMARAVIARMALFGIKMYASPGVELENTGMENHVFATKDLLDTTMLVDNVPQDLKQTKPKPLVFVTKPINISQPKSSIV